ncbi:MAG: hypothetical protein DMF61_12860 [Blastocatellia bacterium AA13]|nr:MAG: hypothetical protein DMF61_12860 [Blastocatellia bacterium AA13]
MKRIATFSFAVALMISFSLMPVGAANRIKRDQAAVSFPETVKLLGVLLRGDYVIVHDEEMMALGEACTYVYTSDSGQPGKLVISFHCEHQEREKVNKFTVRYIPRRGAFDLPEVKEFQFAGDATAHRVP